MDYSVIGDTVNLAARLEGVAGHGEVIISKSTREQIGDKFRIEERPAIKVKGKEKPVNIFSVLDIK
jgi:class 3 adenylate cyclase